MDGAFPLSAQIAEAKAAATALWHRDGEQLAASRVSHDVDHSSSIVVAAGADRHETTFWFSAAASSNAFKANCFVAGPGLRENIRQEIV